MQYINRYIIRILIHCLESRESDNYDKSGVLNQEPSDMDHNLLLWGDKLRSRVANLPTQSIRVDEAITIAFIYQNWPVSTQMDTEEKDNSDNSVWIKLSYAKHI